MSTQTSFDVESIENERRGKEYEDRVVAMQDHPLVPSKRSEGGKKAAATRKANAAKKAEPEPVKAGGITREQSAQLVFLIQAKASRGAEWELATSQVENTRCAYEDASTALDNFIASITVK